MIEHDEVINIRLPWNVICRLACEAYASGQSFNALCEKAIDEQLIRLRFAEMLNEPGRTLTDLVDWASARGCTVNFSLTPRAGSAAP